MLEQPETRYVKTAKSAPSSYVWTVPIILVGFAIRLYQLGDQSLWYDETVSAFLAGQSGPELVAHTARDIHPPAYYLLLHAWTGLAGQSEFALAFLSVIFGLLLIPLTYRLARHLANRPVATWAALLVAFSPFNLWYSQEVRMYTLGAVLGLLASFCALRALEHSVLAGSKKRTSLFFWLGYVTFAALGLYTLYYFAFLLVGLNLLLLLPTFRPKLSRPALLSLFLANGLALSAYLPWLPIAWRQATHPPVPPWRDPQGFSLGSILLESWSALSLGQSIEPANVWPVLLLTAALFLLGLRYFSQLRPRLSLTFPFSAIFLFFYTFGPLLLIYLLSFVSPLYHVRYIFTYSPAFYILLGAGLVWLSRQTRLWVTLALAGLLLAASFYSLYRFHFNPRYRTDDFRAAVQFIQSRWQPGDVILVNAGYTYPAFLYYADLPDLERQRLFPYQPPPDLTQPLLLETGTVNGSPQLGWGDPRSDFYAMSEAETLAALDRLSTDFARLWLLRAYDTVTDPTGLIRTWLANHAIPIEDQGFSGQSNIRVQGFLLPPLPRAAGDGVEFEDGMVLVGWYLPAQTWPPGQTIHLRLWWQVANSPTTDYKMSLKLWDSQGELAAQGQDEWPVGPLYRATDWPVGQTVYHPVELKLPADLPPGQYWLDVQLYHPETVQPLSRLDGRDPVVTLGAVEVQ